MGAVGGALADQWKEFFYCDALPNDILAAKGRRRAGGRSSNTKGDDNIISNGSVIAVADGQCMLIVEQGRLVDVCAEPGEYTYDQSSEPSIFCGEFGESLKGVFARFAFGGEPGKDQRVYYINTKEILGNKYGTASPIPVRIDDDRGNIHTDISVRCFGEYSYKIVDPLTFYTNICANFSGDFPRSELDSQMKSDLLTALQMGFAKVTAQGIYYSQIIGHTKELTEILKEELAHDWREKQGIEIQRLSVSSIKATEEDEKRMQAMQEAASYADPRLAAGYLVRQQGQAMTDAAKNAGGAAVGFMGMNMAAGAGGVNPAQLIQMAQQQPQSAAAPAGSWTCACGGVNTGKFCANCGKPKPAPEGWTCACGTVNQGKFCTNCGGARPAQAAQCAKCGWKPEAGAPAPKFCPNCGEPFGG